MTAVVTVEAGSGSEGEGRAGGAREAGTGRRHATVVTELGELTLVAEGEALVGVYFAEHRPAPDRSTFGEPVDLGQDPVLSTAAQQVADYVSGGREEFDLPFRLLGSERARQVWELVGAVPRGQTTTYAALGRAVGVGPRVAGQLVARNPLCLVVPCHRVVASDGRLTGYAGGVDRKRLLLQREGAVPAGPPTRSTEGAAAAGDDAGPGRTDGAADDAAGAEGGR